MDLSLYPKHQPSKHIRIDQALVFTVYYHSLFGYPLTQSELLKWSPNVSKKFTTNSRISLKDGLYALEGDSGIFLKRVMREHTSRRKMQLAKKAAKILAKIPSIKMVAVTGSLAMANANDDSDIDLLIVCKANTLWTTRLVVYGLLKLGRFQLRKPQDKNEKDKLCLNMWLDETKLEWGNERNFYTAHEICQIVPLVNKAKSYESFLNANKWIKDFWPNAVRINNAQLIINSDHKFVKILNSIAFKIQAFYMRKKITTEKISLNHAFFHPVDWSKEVEKRF